MNPDSTAARVLAELHQRGKVTQRGNTYRCNSPLRAGSDSMGFSLTINDDEHGAWKDHPSGEGGSLYDLAERLGIAQGTPAPAPEQPTVYHSLAEYCGDRYLQAFTAARWKEVQHQHRPALAYPTDTGTRHRFIDGSSPKYTSPQGYLACWYRLPEAVKLAADTGQPLVICNGESSVVTAQAEGVAATCLTSGENNVASKLADRQTGLLGRLLEVYPVGSILLAFDCDTAGRKASRAVLPVLAAAGYEVRAVDLQLGEKQDLRDLARLHQEQTAAQLGSLPDLPPEEPTQAELPAPVGDTAQIKKALHRLLALAEDGQLFRTPDGACYLSVDGQNLSLTRSEATREYFTLRYFETYDSVPQDSSITGAIRILAARARTSEVRQLHSRIAHEGGSIWLDMGNRRAIQITPQGWQVVNDPPVLFRQTPGALPLPEPQRGGKLVDLLRPLANVASETDLHLLAGWLVGTLVPTGAYAFLALSGEQGSGKTTLSTHLRNIIDPNESAVAAFPEKPEELTLIAREAGVLAFDNISRLNRNESDHLCRLSTGAAIRKRQLHTDADIVQISAKVPVILNGIPDLNGTAPDLDSRILAVMLVRRERNTPMRHVDATFAAAHPLLLGAVCDAAATAMRSSYTAENLPRLADFTEWIERAAPALGWEYGYFTSLMEQQAEQHAAAAVENSTLARWLLDLLAEQQEWQGTATELRAALLNSKEVGAGDKPPLDFPKTPKLLGQELRRIESSLRTQGAIIKFTRSNGRNILSLSFDPNIKKEPTLPTLTPLLSDPDAKNDSVGTSKSHLHLPTLPTLPPECLPPPLGSAPSTELAERRAAALAALNGASSTFIACLNAGDWEQITEIIAGAAEQHRGLLRQIYQHRRFSQEDAGRV